jgi:hypothetical protein
MSKVRGLNRIRIRENEVFSATRNEDRRVHPVINVHF